MEDTEIFSTKDPLGRDIILKQSTYDNHLKERHDEKGISDIKKNIENPRYIIKDTREHFSGTQREIYLDMTLDDGKFHTIKTVVEFKCCNSTTGDVLKGEVVTNYIMRKCNDTVLQGGVIYDSSTSVL